MRINKLALTNFRSYNSLELELQPGVITFIGDNGSGKTNIAHPIFPTYVWSRLSAVSMTIVFLRMTGCLARMSLLRLFRPKGSNSLISGDVGDTGVMRGLSHVSLSEP